MLLLYVLMTYNAQSICLWMKLSSTYGLCSNLAGNQLTSLPSNGFSGLTALNQLFVPTTILIAHSESVVSMLIEGKVLLHLKT